MHDPPQSNLGLIPRSPLQPYDFGLLVQIAESICSARTLEDLENRWLELIFHLTPAERVAVLLTDGGLDQLKAMFGADKDPRGGAPSPLCRPLVERVLREGKPHLLCSGSNIAAVPLIVSDRVRGAIYAESNGAAAALNGGHVQLLMALGTIAVPTLDHAVREDLGRLDARPPAEEDGTAAEWAGILLGRAPATSRVRRMISRIGPSDCTVLIQGESGTGKELAARAIHLASPRAARPLVPINCAALTETLLESELF
jgi:hypothetical protein